MKAIRLIFLASTAMATPALAQGQARSLTSGDPVAVAPASDAQNALNSRDIIVTAQKREGTVQQTPLAISAVGGAELQSRQITNIEALAPSLPGVSFGQQAGFARIFIRGLGLDVSAGGQEGRIAFHTDGVYISRPSAQLSSFFDVNRVEVVRGPQGTLYGRNATGGAINVITNDPENSLGGFVRGTVGNYHLFQQEGALTGPITDGISGRIAFINTDRGGYGKNLTLGQDIDDEHSYALRGKLKIAPSEDFSLILSADYSHQNDRAFYNHFTGRGAGVNAAGVSTPTRATALGGLVPSNPRDTFANTPWVNYRTFWGLGATATANLGFATLTSITGYRDSKMETRGDHEDTQIDVSHYQVNEYSKQYSEELRLDGDIGRLKWLIGGFYFHEKIYAESVFSPFLSFTSPAFPSRGAVFNGHFKTDAQAVFGQLDYEIIDNVTLSAGLRYSHEKKSIDQRGAVELFVPYSNGFTPNYTLFQDRSITFNSTTPRFSVEWKPSNNLLFYATYAKGFKSGGFSLTNFTSIVKPEKLEDFEGGFKVTVMNGGLRVNGSVFHYNYDDLQVQKVLGNTSIVVNAASAKVDGVEGEIVIRPVQGLELSANGSYLDARFTDFVSADEARPALGNIDLSGNRLAGSPKWAGNAAAQYTIPVASGDVQVRGEVVYKGLIYYSFYNRPDVAQDSNTKFNANLNYNGNSGVTVSLWIKNIGNKRTYGSQQPGAGFLGFPIIGIYDPPRTFGVSVGYRF